jgi:aerotaxis receptor
MGLSAWHERERVERSMRLNEPVTQQEYPIPDDVTLMSTTNTKSDITYANAAFVRTSGFSLDELVGQAHNLVRHPDMPPEAFADMWATLQSGEPWTALVKNRRKNGDHYWVRANAVPVIRQGRHQGYLSIRTKPPRPEVDEAAAMYQALRRGESQPVRLRKGVWIRNGFFWQPLAWLQSLSVRARIRVSVLAFWAVLSVVLTVFMAVDAPSWQVCAFIGLAALGLDWLLESQLARPLEKLCRHALDVATGNDRDAVHLNRTDEIGTSMRAIDQMGLMLRWLADDVSEQVLAVRQAASDMENGTDELRQRTEQSAASVAQTASFVQRMASSVTDNASAAEQAWALSGEACQAVARGEQAMGQVVGTMQAIEHSSRKINEIIEVIDTIAAQTNLLALNAAVEAARAGEVGRGFAVVASEVRSLAQRSADAAGTVRALIRASGDQVAEGARLVMETRHAIAGIAAQAQRVSEHIGQISGATQEQRDGIAEVSNAITHLDQITRQNADLVEQNSASSHQLDQQMQRLVEAISVIR